MKKFFLLSLALLMSLSFTACGSDDDNKNDGTTPGDTNESTISTDTKYKDPSYGTAAVEACATVVTNFEAANLTIATAELNKEQETYLRNVLSGLVSNVIVPTYTKLADDVEDLEKTLNGLTTNNITQAQINKACEDFKDARENWERSEAFLMGAASDFDIDPTIDSWPLNRSLLLSYFQGGMKPEMLEDATILGFHALEFILFRNGQPRKVAEFQGNDTYKNFEKITGAQELKYAQTISTLLKQRCFQLQVAWEGEKNASRVSVVKAAGLDYTTEAGLSYGDNLILAGQENSKSTFTSLEDAIAQVLSDDEGSCVGIANEVGTAKIANPFAAGDISYVESPYSYNSITDFQDNIRSIRNVWYGSTNGTPASISFYNFFQSVDASNVNTSVTGAFNDAINKIGAIPAPFVKYCSTIWDIEFTDDEDWATEE